MHLRNLGALALAGVLTLSACSSDDPEPKVAPTPSASAAPSPKPSPSADAVPLRPESATEFTSAGAAALVEYFWEAATYAQATGDVAPLSEVATTSCTPCESGRQAVTAVYEAGGQITGGGNTVEILRTRRVTLRSGPAFQVEARVTNRAQQVDMPDDTKDGSFDASTIRATFVVVEENGTPLVSFWDAK